MIALPIALTPDRLVSAVEDRRAVLLDVIRSARRRITLSLFRCNDEEIIAELAAAAARGVLVEVLVTSRAKGGRKRKQKLWRALERTGASLRAYTDPVVKYHPKYLVADEGPAVVASLNFTRKCFRKTCDALVVTHDPAVVSDLRRLWTADRDRQPMPDDLTERLIVGPERARRQFTALDRRRADEHQAHRRQAVGSGSGLDRSTRGAPRGSPSSSSPASGWAI